MFVSWHNKYDWKFTSRYAEIFQFLGEQVHYQQLSGFKSISMEGTSIEHFKKFKPSNITMALLKGQRLNPLNHW